MRLQLFSIVLVASATAIAQTSAPAGPPSQPAPVKRLQAAAVSADLKSSLDSKKAKEGDTVTAVVSADADLADGVHLPKGTTLNGRVLKATSYDKKSGNKMGSVTVVFDEAKAKDGTVTPIVSMVRELKPSPMAQYLATQQGGGGGDASMAPPSSSGPPSGAANAAGAGSSASPVTPSMQGNSGMSSGGLASRDAATKEAVTDAPAGAVQTAIPGVLLAPPPDPGASATVAASGKNVHVDSGSQLMLAVATRPKQPM